jgi:DNA-binding CsgD family transcriptional regulator
MSTVDTCQEQVERTREIVSATTAFLGDASPCPLPADGDLFASDAALGNARRALVRRLHRDAEMPHEAPDDRAAALVLESVATQASVKDALLQHRADVAMGVREALSTLRNATSTAALAERAPIEVRRIGFRRALFSKIDKGTWLASSAFAVDDHDFSTNLVAVGKANPRRLNGPLIESEMVRRCTPVVVSDAQSNPRVHLQLVRYTETSSYVAAPVLAWGIPVAMVHADRDTDCEVDEFDRHMLGAYTEGLGLALERTQLMERLQVVRRATSEYSAGVNAIADDFTADILDAAGIALEACSGDRAGVRPTFPTGEHNERLTPREWDVLRNLASGKTNAQIATGLFVTEGTVKSHVKHILRKLGATNRTEAVARYHRLSTAAGGSKAC